MLKLMSLACAMILACSIANASTVTVEAPASGTGFYRTSSVGSWGMCSSSGVFIEVKFRYGSTVEKSQIVSVPGGSGGGPGLRHCRHLQVVGR